MRLFAARRHRREVRGWAKAGTLEATRNLAHTLITDPDAEMREIASEALRALSDLDLVEAATDVLIDTGDEGLARALAAAPTSSAYPGRRALALLLADGDRPQPTLDAEVLRSTFAAAGSGARAAIVARARGRGHDEWIRAIARPHGPGAPSGTAVARPEAPDLVALASAARGPQLWQQLPDTDPLHAAEALRALDRAGWRPRSAAEEQLLHWAARCPGEPPCGVVYAQHAVRAADYRSIGSGSVLSPNGRILAVPGADDDGLRLWRLPAGEPLGTVGPPGRQAVKVTAFSPDGRWLACDDGWSTDHSGFSIGLWDVSSCEPVAVLVGARAVPESLVITPDGATLIALSWDYAPQHGTTRELTFWRLPDGRHERTLAVTCSSDRHELLCTADGSALMACCDEGVHRWALPSADPLPGLAVNVQALLWSSPDGHELVIRGREQAQVRRVPEGDLLGEVPLSLTGAAPGVHRGLTPVSPDGRFLLTTRRHGPAGGDAARYELPTARPVEPLRGPGGRIEHLAVTADGRVVAGGSTDGRVRVWLQSSGELLAVLDGGPNRLVLTLHAAHGTLVGLAGREIFLWPALLPQLSRTPVREIALTDVDRLRASPSELSSDDERAWTALIGELVAWCRG